MPRISICILTYQRAAFLDELLASILAQDRAELEVVVSDDASPDRTVDIAEGYQARFRNFRYFRQPTNVGIDRNFLTAVEMATGDFVWLMGDDDRLEPGAVQHVLSALDTWPAAIGMTVGVIDYDERLSRATGLRQMPETQLMNDAETVFSTMSDLLGFMSALVIKRHVWNRVVAEEPVLQYDKYYLQVYVTGRAIQRFGPWGVLNVPCVGFRSSNDQFLARFGWFDRLKIDVIAYEQIINDLFRNDDSTRNRARERIFDTHIVSRIRNAKSAQAMGIGEQWKATTFLHHHYHMFTTFWINALPLLWMPRTLVRFLRRIYQDYSPTSGKARARKLARSADLR